MLNTGKRVLRKTCLDVLPKNVLCNIPFPCEPMTMASQSSFSAVCKISSAANPSFTSMASIIFIKSGSFLNAGLKEMLADLYQRVSTVIPNVKLLLHGVCQIVSELKLLNIIMDSLTKGFNYVHE